MYGLSGKVEDTCESSSHTASAPYKDREKMICAAAVRLISSDPRTASEIKCEGG